METRLAKGTGPKLAVLPSFTEFFGRAELSRGGACREDTMAGFGTLPAAVSSLFTESFFIIWRQATASMLPNESSCWSTPLALAGLYWVFFFTEFLGPRAVPVGPPTTAASGRLESENKRRTTASPETAKWRATAKVTFFAPPKRTPHLHAKSPVPTGPSPKTPGIQWELS